MKILIGRCHLSLDLIMHISAKCTFHHVIFLGERVQKAWWRVTDSCLANSQFSWLEAGEETRQWWYGSGLLLHWQEIRRGQFGQFLLTSGEASQWETSFQADWLCGNGPEVWNKWIEKCSESVREKCQIYTLCIKPLLKAAAGGVVLPNRVCA